MQSPLLLKRLHWALNLSLIYRFKADSTLDEQSKWLYIVSAEIRQGLDIRPTCTLALPVRNWNIPLTIIICLIQACLALSSFCGWQAFTGHASGEYHLSVERRLKFQLTCACIILQYAMQCHVTALSKNHSMAKAEAHTRLNSFQHEIQ